ncbi:RNaseH domain-containing protein [Kitasatospora sp. NPDC054795]
MYFWGTSSTRRGGPRLSSASEINITPSRLQAETWPLTFHACPARNRGAGLPTAGWGTPPNPSRARARSPSPSSTTPHPAPPAARRRGWNTNALEITPAFLQPDDDPAEWAMYVQSLRTAHLHTNVATRLPHPLHAADLAARYIQRWARVRSRRAERRS